LKKTLSILLLTVVFGAWQASAASAATVWAVGDGADIYSNDDALAARIQSQGPFDRFLYLGDIYDYGTAQEWTNNYEPSFGRFKSITSPTPGNHEWANRATGYDPYWGSLAPQNGGGHYYSTDLNGWHIVSLNSQEDTSSTSPQVAWLRQDLARYPGTCTLSFWHRPRYSASNTGGDGNLEPLWAELAGHSVANITGHHHNYQRLKPNRGILPLIAGAGGHFFHTVTATDTRLDAFNDAEYGALRMELSPGRMDYAYVTAGGATIDSGSIPCTPHTTTPPPNAAPSASFGYTPASASTADTVTFNSTSTDPDGTIAAQEWDLDNDGLFDDATGGSAARRFPTAGTYTVRLRVTDDKGASSVASRQLTVGNQAPSASFTYSPATPLRRETVTFASTSADADGSIVSQRWDLDNDGQFDDASGLTAARSFDSAGSYTVRLQVTDNGGAASVTNRVVTVYRRRPVATTAAAWTRGVVAPPPLTAAGPGKAVPQVQILQALPLTLYRRQPKVLLGRARHASEPVRLTLTRRSGGRCRAFDGLRFRRSSCRNNRRSFAAGGRDEWSYRLPLDLPGGTYELTARVRGTNGRLAAQSVVFRMKAPVRVRRAPVLTEEQAAAEERREGRQGS